MDKNLTLKLDETLLREARRAAVDDDTSLSAWVAGLISETLRQRDRRRSAKRAALKHLEGFDLNPGRFTRDELHER